MTVVSFRNRKINSILSAWTGGERSMNVLYNLVKHDIPKSHIAYVIWKNYPSDAHLLNK